MKKFLSKNWRVTKNKFFEVEFYYCEEPTHPFHVWWEWTRKTDHAGIKMWQSLFGFNLDISFYDHRHWDGLIKTWAACKPGECPLEDYGEKDN